MPAVSIIIPLYNAEKYIGECLDSILAQTFRDFEVIVVDDCSTDNSVAVVKSYFEKFGGRLKIVGTLKNSGNPGFPRNKGLYLSRGEYLFMLDNDDAITPTALEELYIVAKNSKADVVACERYYVVPDKIWDEVDFETQRQTLNRSGFHLVNEPTLLSNGLSERLELCKKKVFLWNLWSKLIRRDLIFENELSFADTIIDDFVLTMCLLCTAGRFVVVPNIVNYYRNRQDSLSHTREDAAKYFRKYVKALLSAFRYFDNFSSERAIFRARPDLKYTFLELCRSEILFGYLFPLYAQNPLHVFDEILREELSREDNLALAAFTFSEGTFYRLRYVQAQRRIVELENEINRLKNKE